MRFISPVLCAINLFAISQAAVVKPVTIHFKGVDGVDREYKVEPAHFVGTVNGKDFAHNGTIQEFRTAALKIDPAFKFETAGTSPKREEVPELTERTPTGRICGPVPGQPWQFCDRDRIYEGINYLRALNRRIYVNPRTCSRVSCSYKAAIWMCNDLYGAQVYPTSNYMAGCANDIANNCYRLVGSDGDVVTLGQQFDSSYFNIIVRGDNC